MTTDMAHRMGTWETVNAGRYAAIFIDYENVYYFLRRRYANIPELHDFIVDLLLGLQKQLEEKFNVRPIITKAYADYERIRNAPQGSLYLMGVETVYVLGTDHKNAADMRLCIDAMETLYSRSEIGTFVIFAGDRDYIPLIQHVKKLAKRVISVGFEENFSGDLMLNVGRSNFIDAMGLWTAEQLAKLEEVVRRYNQEVEAEQEWREQHERSQTKLVAATPLPGDTVPLLAEEDSLGVVSDETGILDTPEPGRILDTGEAGEAVLAETESEGDDRGPTALPIHTFVPGSTRTSYGPHDQNELLEELSENEQACLDLLIGSYGHYREIFLAPFLRALTDTLPNLADWERKIIIDSLQHKGVLRIEKRKGIPYGYTVVILDYKHPAVLQMR